MLATRAVRAMARSSKTYADAIQLLNTCQSNAATIEAIRKSGGRLNDYAVAEMHDYLRRIGYAATDLDKLNVVHITGTKGKGSTSAFTERILRAHLPGRIGLYTSPHLCAVRERIRINGEPLSEDEFARYFFEVWERLEADPKPLYPHTPIFPIYFRLLTLMAFHTFLSLGVSATVLEVGIGGTYDSTNLVPSPIVTGVSALGLDHVAVLGHTIGEIARNKGGIYKAGVPALSVRQVGEHAEGEDVLRECADRVGAPFEVVQELGEGVELGLRGKHQRVNASLAVGLAKRFLERQGILKEEKGVEVEAEGMVPKSFEEPLRQTKWPGRCQVVRRGRTTWFLDGAHTTESLASCGEWAWEGVSAQAGEGEVEGEPRGQPDVLVFNCSGGRTGQILLTALLEAGARAAGVDTAELGKRFKAVLFCTNVTYTDGHFKGDLTSHAIDPNDLSALATQHALAEAWSALFPTYPKDRVHVLASIEHAVDVVKELEKQGEEPKVLVAGSLHLVGGVMEVAGLQDALGMA